MYTKIEDGIWRKMKQNQLSETAKILYLYLFTCPHRNMIGLYYIPLAYCSADLGMEPERVSEGFRELQNAGLLLCDEAEEMVLLPDFLRVNPLDNTNVEKKACTVFSALPETRLFGPFGAILEQLPKPFPHLLERVSERYGNTEDRKQKTETEDRIPKAEAEGRMQKTETEHTAAPCDAAAAEGVWEEPPAIWLPLNDGTEYGVPWGDVEEYRQLYPAVDVDQELRSMRGWLLNNPKNRKTQGGIRRFINGWLERSQNKVPRQGGSPPTSFSALAAQMDNDAGGEWR